MISRGVKVPCKWLLGSAILWGSPCFARDATVRLQNSQYVSHDTAFFRNDASSQNTSFALRVQRDWRWSGSLAGHLDLKNEFSATEQWNYVNPYQAYVRSRLPAGVGVSFGRKRETWNSTEEDWRQGVFQPRFMQNKFLPELAGLTGVFLSSSIRSWLWTAAILPVHIPDLGARFWVSENRLVSMNPWFDPPASKFRIRSPTSDIRYSVDKPPMDEMIGHPGLAAKIESSGERLGTRVSAAYKPIPQILLGFPSRNRVIVKSDEDYLDVVITPRIQYHWVGSTEVWGHWRGWMLAASLAHDHPVADAMPEGWTSQTFAPAWIGSLSFSRPLEEDGDQAKRMKFGLLKITGGQGRDRGEYAGPDSLFEGRFQYREAYMAGLSWPLRGVLRSMIETEARVAFDRLQNGGTLAFAAGYRVTRDFRVDIEAEWLGLLGESQAAEEGFLSTYRANDRVGLGVSYVF